MKRQRLKPSILDDVFAHTIDDAGCLVWQRSCCNGHPAVRVGEKTILVRRYLWEKQHGTIDPGKVIRMACECKLCVNPEHMKLTTYKQIGKECGKLGLMSGAKRSAKIAATKRLGKQSKMTEEAVNMLRSGQIKATQAPDQFGITYAHARKIIRGDAWRDFKNPFAALMM